MTDNMGKREDNFQFDFERLEVYKLALEFLSKIFKVYRTLPKDLQYSLGSQLIRGGVSISNNLAEGSGKKSKKHKLSYHNISLDSTRECISMNNVLLKEKLIDRETYTQIRLEGRRITSMIVGLINSL
ncbi:MAG: four helix bundle protein [Actinomycetota bacterium]|nr:four helix bundle protein [Actinomycetota bacterium]